MRVARVEARERILRAATKTLAELGFARTTARAIADTGGFAPGVIYYHFADLDDLFAATVEFTSQARLARYRAETDGLTSAAELITRLRALFAEDRAEGHVAAVQELVAAAASSPRLAEQVRAAVEIWRSFAETLIGRFVASTPFAGLVPVSELATAAVAGYLGLEMLSHLHADPTPHEALFDAAHNFAAILDSLH